MRKPDGLTTLLLVLLLALAVVAALGWLRPVRIVTPDPYRAKYDSLQMVTERYQANAAKAMHDADRWQMVADSLARVRVDVVGTVGDARKALKDASVDSLRAVLMREPQ